MWRHILTQVLRNCEFCEKILGDSRSLHKSINEFLHCFAYFMTTLGKIGHTIYLQVQMLHVCQTTVRFSAVNFVLHGRGWGNRNISLFSTFFIVFENSLVPKTSTKT
jgi:hypothetical protein